MYNSKSPPNQGFMADMYWVLGVVLLFWLVELINLFMAHRLNYWGIYPRTIRGLIGIPLSPFLHGGIGHILLNTIPFTVLGGFVILRGKQIFFELSLFIMLFGGAALWLLGRSSYHVGASGLIFGYFGFLVARGWFDQSLKSIVIAFITLFLYGGILWGLLPTFSFISWEGHLFGLIAGILGARLESTK